MDFILNPFVTLLTFLYSVLGNDMVIAITVFTIIVRVITHPLTMQQQRSTKAMQVVQPELKKLQEKYKNDREKLSQEQMRLYREHGINPLGGCLPLLIQFPILIALYQAIIHSLAATPLQMIDLSNRLLIPGLEQSIPLNNMWLGLNLTQPPDMGASVLSLALPVLVVVTTWLQFKLTMPQTPPSGDGKPDQAQAMSRSMGTVMPLMYGFFALSFSVGLSIYFIVSNLVSIVQYSLMGKVDLKALLGRGSASSAAAPAQIEGKASAPKVKPAQKTSKAK